MGEASEDDEDAAVVRAAAVPVAATVWCVDGELVAYGGTLMKGEGEFGPELLWELGFSKEGSNT